MARAGLRKVYKTVRGKHGTHRRAYYMRSDNPKPSAGRRLAGAALGATLGAVGGALFGGAAGAGLGATTAARGVHNDMRHGLQTHYGTSHIDALPRSIHHAYGQDYLKRNAGAVAGHVGSRAALGGVWGAGAGAAGGAAFGAALGYAAASRLGRGGRRGGLKNEDPGHGRSLGTGSQWRSWSERPRTSPPGKERANTATEDRLVREYMSRRGR